MDTGQLERRAQQIALGELPEDLDREASLFRYEFTDGEPNAFRTLIAEGGALVTAANSVDAAVRGNPSWEGATSRLPGRAQGTEVP